MPDTATARWNCLSPAPPLRWLALVCLTTLTASAAACCRDRAVATEARAVPLAVVAEPESARAVSGAPGLAEEWDVDGKRGAAAAAARRLLVGSHGGLPPGAEHSLECADIGASSALLEAAWLPGTRFVVVRAASCTMERRRPRANCFMDSMEPPPSWPLRRRRPVRDAACCRMAESAFSVASGLPQRACSLDLIRLAAPSGRGGDGLREYAAPRPAPPAETRGSSAGSPAASALAPPPSGRALRLPADREVGRGARGGRGAPLAD